jgi:hypothetical protein
MTITNYVQVDGGVVRDDGLVIPCDPANSDWQEYLLLISSEATDQYGKNAFETENK